MKNRSSKIQRASRETRLFFFFFFPLIFRLRGGADSGVCELLIVILESGHVADELGPPKAECSGLSWPQSEGQALTTLKSYWILFWKTVFAFAFLPCCCKAKSFSHLEVIWDPCVRGAALRGDSEPDSLFSHLQAEPVTGGSTMDLADSKSTHSVSGAQRYREQQLDPKRLFNLGDKEILSNYWRMKLDKFDSE